jgi:hypothetical protein
MIPSKRGLSKYRCVAATSCSNGVSGFASASMMDMGLRSSLSQVPADILSLSLVLVREAAMTMTVNLWPSTDPRAG